MPGPQYEGGQILNPAEMHQVGLTPPGPLGLLQPGVAPPKSELERTMPPGLSLKQRLQTYGPGLLGSLVALGGRGPLTRTIGGALTAGGAGKLLGGEFGPEAAKFAGTQGIAELGFGLGRFGKGQVRAKAALEKAEKDFTAATEAHQKAVEQQAAQHRTALEQHQTTVTGLKTQYRDLQAQRAQVVAQQQADFAKAQRDFAQKGAGSIADAYKEMVPSWKEFPSNEAGLAEMVYGAKGRAKLGQMYDASLKEIISSGRGIQLPMRIEDVETLKLRPLGVVDAERPTHAYVDAGELATALPGKWESKKTRQAYNNGFDVLDQHNLGNEEARTEYRLSRSLVKFTDQSGMLRGGGGGEFDPAAAKLALYKLKDVDTLITRKAGDVFRGPIAEAVQQPGPLAPTPPPKVTRPILPPSPLSPPPLTPPKKPETGISKYEAPLAVIPGALAGAAIGHATSIPHLTWLGAMGGAETGRRFGPRMPIYTGGQPSAPTPPILPTGLAELLRLYLTRPRGTST